MIVSQSPMPGSDTLFRLIANGSQTLQSKGYSRKAQENVVAPMPEDLAVNWSPQTGPFLRL